MNIKPICVPSTLTYRNVNKNFQSKKQNKVIDDGDYVKIPKEKYNREKFWNNVENALLSAYFLYLLIDLYLNRGKPPFP